MKFHKSLTMFILLVLVLSFTGCGTALTELTEEEEETIVLYAAKIVAQYNTSKDDGYCYVADWVETLIDEMEAAAAEEAALDEAPLEGEAEGADGLDEANPEEDVAQDTSITMTEALAIDNLICTYITYELMDSYITSDVSIADPGDGYSYLVLRFQLTNNSSEDRVINLLTAGNSYSLTVNGDTQISCYSTLSMEDLSTYYNSQFEAWASDDVVLIFKAPSELSISSLELSITRNDYTYQVTL